MTTLAISGMAGFTRAIGTGDENVVGGVGADPAGGAEPGVAERTSSDGSVGRAGIDSALLISGGSSTTTCGAMLRWTGVGKKDTPRARDAGSARDGCGTELTEDTFIREVFFSVPGAARRLSFGSGP